MPNDPDDESGTPFDIEIESFDERLEPPTTGQHENSSRSDLDDLAEQESRA